MRVVVPASCFLYASSLTVLSSLLHRRLNHQSAMLNGRSQAREASCRRYSRSKCGSRQQSSGGMALTILSLAEHTLLMNDRWNCYITVSPRRFTSLFTAPSLRSIRKRTFADPLSPRDRLQHSSFTTRQHVRRS